VDVHGFCFSACDALRASCNEWGHGGNNDRALDTNLSWLAISNAALDDVTLGSGSPTRKSDRRSGHACTIQSRCDRDM
jgi:hypothetical protein